MYRYNCNNMLLCCQGGDWMVGLREIRRKKKLSQQRVALDLNITREALSHYENGARDSSRAMLVQLSELC